MATPTTQGVALLMRQYLWDGYYPHGEPTAGDEMHTPPPSAALIKALLVNSGGRMTGLYTDNGTGGSWPSNGQGWGRVKAGDALYFQGDHRDAWIRDEYSPAGTTGLATNNAEGSLSTYWTTESGTQFGLPWTKDATYNHTWNPPLPGESYWSQNAEFGADALDADARLFLTQPITIPVSVSSARLTFYSRFFNEPDDTGKVEVSTDGGATWAELLKITDAPQAPPVDTRMQHHEVDLTAYRGQSIRLRFRFESTSNYFLFLTSGWWVDDIVIGGATWQTIAVVPPDQTQLDVAGRIDGEHSYRVRSGFTDGSASAFSNVEGIRVELPNTAAGRVPSGADDPPLAVTKVASGDLTLEWGESCNTGDTDYEVYEGTLGDFTSHSPLVCSTSGALEWTFTPAAGDTYYLIVPRNASREGSYGLDSSGNERPVGAEACLVQRIESCP
jgi:hypothetical protein